MPFCVGNFACGSRSWQALVGSFSNLGTRRRVVRRSLSVMSSSYDKVRGGSLSFKNGGSLAVKKKSKKSKKGSKSKEAAAEAAALSVGQGTEATPGATRRGPTRSSFRTRASVEEGKGRSNCWGTNYRQAPDVPHGYTTSWKGKKREEMTHGSAWAAVAAKPTSSPNRDVHHVVQHGRALHAHHLHDIVGVFVSAFMTAAGGGAYPLAGLGRTLPADRKRPCGAMTSDGRNLLPMSPRLYLRMCLVS